MKANVVLLIIIIIGNNTKTKQKPTCFWEGYNKSTNIYTVMQNDALCKK